MGGITFDSIDNSYIAITLALIVALYGIQLGKFPLPNFISGLFKNPLFRIAFLSLLLINNFNTTPHVALIVVLVFVITMEHLNRHEMEQELDQFISM